MDAYLSLQYNSQAVQILRGVRHDPQRRAHLRLRVVQASEFFQRVAEIEVCLETPQSHNDSTFAQLHT